MAKAIQGIYHNGKLEPLEEIPYKEDKRIIIVFLDDGEDNIWEKGVARDFMNGYSDKDTAYDTL